MKNYLFVIELMRNEKGSKKNFLWHFFRNIEYKVCRWREQKKIDERRKIVEKF